MTTAVYVLTLISTIAFIAAVVSLLQRSRDRSELTWGWTAIFVTLCASGPLLSFALGVGNLSVMATAFALLAFATKHNRRLWLPASSLALAILLKPHLGIWIGIGMLVLRERPRRAIAIRAAGIVAAFTGVLALVLEMKGSLAMQMQGLQSILNLEASPGWSMNVSSREVLPIEAQITSLQSLLGFWSADHLLTLLIAVATLSIAAWWLVRATLRVETEEETTLALGSWVAFGLLVTYHRAHDAIALLLLLPFLLNQLRTSPRDWKGWAIAGLYLSMSVGPSIRFISLRLAASSEHSLLSFVMLRQAGIADLCLLMTLFLTLHIRLLRHQAPVERVWSRANAWNIPLGDLRPVANPAYRSVRSGAGAMALTTPLKAPRPL
jgi:energy-converting hydrogenase Eha subunit E